MPEATDNKLKLTFDTKAFLATVGVGVSIKQYLKNESIFDQGDVAETTMQSALDEQPKFSALFTSHLLSRSARIEDDLIDQLFNSSERRLARLLLLLANFGKEGLSGTVPVTLSQEALAEIIGTTRSRMSFFMNQFRKNGLISYNGKIKVHASLLDAVLHEKPHIKDAE